MPDRPPSERSTLPFVRVVVLNWNAAWLTARCVRSLQATDYPADRFEIVVVDNASIDGSLQRLQRDLHGVRFVENPSNLGFAEGNNRALRDLEGCDHVALVNNDAVVEPGWLRPLVDALAAERRAGAAVPKMLLEATFVPVAVAGSATFDSISVDGVDVTRTCLFEATFEHPHPTRPLGLLHEVRGSAAVHVPVPPALDDPADAEIVVRWTDPTEGLTLDEAGHDRAGDLRVTATGDTSLTLAAGSHRERRVNSLGTELTPWTEATERWFGALDRPNLAPHEVWGFSGGGVLLRAEMLRDVGVFDPSFFAYYEDTDLAWRAQARGWHVVCRPDAVVHHLHGGSAGTRAQGFFFLNYRNWLLTVLRNGSPRQLLRAASTARTLSWKPFRRAVIGPARRGHRPDFTITTAWLRVLAGVAALLPNIVASRLRGRRVGLVPTDRVRSRFMPHTPPRAPGRRPGGPDLCYLDVTVTLRSGWRAGIQRVVCELFRTLPEANPDVEFVPICWSKVHRRFRRIDAAEYASLLAPTAAQQPAAPLPPPTALRRLLARVMHTSGAAPLVHAMRRRRELRAVPAHHRDLLLDHFERGSAFLDLDATWNPTTLERSVLLPELRAAGVHTLAVQHDLIPCTHPSWFIPQLVDVFVDHLDAHLAAGSEFLCNSEHTRSTLVTYAHDRGLATPATTVLPMGVSVRERAAEPVATAVPEHGSFFLAVGTVEPRKNYGVVLDAFEKVRAEHADAHLVVVGRPGWRNDQVVDRLRAGPPGVDWRSSVSDDELDLLYTGAAAVIVASITEGFGLPVIEALHAGVPVISSTGGSLPEAGGELVEYFDPSSASELADLLSRHLADPDHRDRRRAVTATYEPRSWNETAVAVGRRLRSTVRPRR